MTMLGGILTAIADWLCPLGYENERGPHHRESSDDLPYGDWPHIPARFRVSPIINGRK